IVCTYSNTPHTIFPAAGREIAHARRGAAERAQFKKTCHGPARAIRRPRNLDHDKSYCFYLRVLPSPRDPPLSLFTGKGSRRLCLLREAAVLAEQMLETNRDFAHTDTGGVKHRVRHRGIHAHVPELANALDTE